MVITRTPVRLSFFGGGTDYYEYFSRCGGAVLGTTIDKYSYLSVNRLSDFFDHTFRVTYSKCEITGSVDEILHPSVRETLRHLGLQKKREIHYFADLPAKTGLGSSSAFTVGLLNALSTLEGKSLTKAELAEQAIHIERERIGENVGFQDQYHAAYGGLNLIRFAKDKREVFPLRIMPSPREEISRCTMLFFTGLTRFASDVLREQVEKTRNTDNDAFLAQMHRMVDQGAAVLENDFSLSAFGHLLHASWELKKQLSRAISNPEIDRSYQRALDAGALGGKLAGAGSGGFLMLIVPLERQAAVRQALVGLKEVEFEFEKEGSTVVYKQE
jgi:D-glycero-alpha-D-manno-heptose-7-phosphate kinase